MQLSVTNGFTLKLVQYHYNRLYGKCNIIVISWKNSKVNTKSIELSKILYRKFSHYLLSFTWWFSQIWLPNPISKHYYQKYGSIDTENRVIVTSNIDIENIKPQTISNHWVSKSISNQHQFTPWWLPWHSCIPLSSQVYRLP